MTVTLEESVEKGDEDREARRGENSEEDDGNVRMDRIAVKTGNHLIDQFDLVYVGTAFAFYILIQLWFSRYACVVKE